MNKDKSPNEQLEMWITRNAARGTLITPVPSDWDIYFQFAKNERKRIQDKWDARKERKAIAASLQAMDGKQTTKTGRL